jgi:hypothetical protein
MKRFGGSVPTSDGVTYVSSDADPDVAPRVFKQTKNIITRQWAALQIVDGLREGVCELVQARHVREAARPDPVGTHHSPV